MAGMNPFAKLAPAKGKPATKGKPVSAASAKAVANFVKGKKMDAEDKLDGGVDEQLEKD